MKVLTIDTSSVTACSGVVDTTSDKVLSESFIDVPLTHSQTVLPMTERVLSHAEIAFEDIDLLAVCNGPGSFTGVRIGVAAVKGLGFEQDRLCAPVSTLEALACGTPIAVFATGGCPEAVTEECGIVIPKGDQQGLCDAIEKLCQESAERKSACIERSKAFDCDLTFRSYLSLYKELCQ